MSEAESDWTAALVADSEAALRRLCVAVEDGAEQMSSTQRTAGGLQPLGEPADEPEAGANVGILQAITALRTAVVGAADLATERTRRIVETLPGDSASFRQSDAGVLLSRGQSTLRRLLGDSAAQD
ncbi:hypothetical protein FHR72_002311 [Mycolicibacterium iranicum]|uniref:Uncharacterized protein n=1 Tax=Mycolicibacterium iranicum TaxID=912594 RepID=A0A839Q3K0_MYCIR|nr:hypothetical protein [Mycolicibacterium iranicum]MBB2990838.1 hypothetical protein [Mycolicibacterium iranicum]